MPFFVIHAQTQDQADALKITLESDVLSRSRAHSVSTAIDGSFTGRFVTAFEMSDFTPDPGTIVDGNGNPINASDAWAEFETSECAGLFGENKNYRVRWDGRLCGPGAYGHFNGCRYLVLVENVLECEEENL